MNINSSGLQSSQQISDLKEFWGELLKFSSEEEASIKSKEIVNKFPYKYHQTSFENTYPNI